MIKMKNIPCICIALVLCTFIYFADKESQLEKTHKHEYIMKKLLLEPKYAEDSVGELYWKSEYKSLQHEYDKLSENTHN